MITEERQISELGELTSGRQSDEEITICDLTGVGVQDTSIALLAYKSAVGRGLGTSSGG
jgi:ornithine cyclodeaminase